MLPESVNGANTFIAPHALMSECSFTRLRMQHRHIYSFERNSLRAQPFVQQATPKRDDFKARVRWGTGRAGWVERSRSGALNYARTDASLLLYEYKLRALPDIWSAFWWEGYFQRLVQMVAVVLGGHFTTTQTMDYISEIKWVASLVSLYMTSSLKKSPSTLKNHQLIW